MQGTIIPRGRSGRRAFIGHVEALEARQVLSQFVVSPSGDDAAAGTAAAPWRTLQRAANLVQPGDSVSVKAGSYTGFNLTTSGSAASPIVFKADPGVSITAPNPWNQRDGINLEGASYVTVDGFSVSGMPRAGIRSVTNTNVTIRNNTSDLNTFWGILTGFSENLLIENNTTTRSVQQHGIYVSNSADNPVIRNNLVWGNAGSGIQLNSDVSAGGDGIIKNALVEGNIIRDNGVLGGAALNNDGVQDSVFRNNLLYNNHASGITFFQQNGAEGAKNNRIVNNTIVNAADGRWAATVSGGSTGNVFRNNILYTGHSFRGSITVAPDSLAGFTSDYNVVKDRLSPDGENTILTLAAWRAATGHDTHSVVSDPTALFVNPSAGDYRLKSGSPAFDVGSNAFAPPADLAGTTRPQGVSADIGAYETAVTTVTSSADFLGLDAATKGNWNTRFGSDGAYINGGANTTPAYASVAITGAQSRTWAATTRDTRALLKTKTSITIDRVAAAWYSPTTIQVDLDLNDGQAHRVGFYFLDWDQSGARNQRVEIVDAGSGTVINTQSISGFQGGQYLSWTLKGHVIVRLTNLGTTNAVLGGMFFGAMGTPIRPPLTSGVAASPSLAPAAVVPSITLTSTARKPNRTFSFFGS